MWAFRISSLSSFKSNSLWKQPGERFMAEGISWEDLLSKFRVGADADKVTMLIWNKNLACKGVFNVNKSIFHEGQWHCSKLQLYFICQYSHESPLTDMVTRLQWTMDLIFFHPASVRHFLGMYLPCARVCVRFWTYTTEQDKQGPCSFGAVVGWIMAPRDVSKSLKFMNITLYSKGDFAGLIKLRILC